LLSHAHELRALSIEVRTRARVLSRFDLLGLTLAVLALVAIQSDFMNS